MAGKKHPKTDVPFDEDGLPNFSDYLYSGSKGKAEVVIELSGNRKIDEKLANKAAGFKATPEGYTWHHHQEVGRMQLVKSDAHKKTGHTGGFSLNKDD